MKKIFISFWGKFDRWREVSYIVLSNDAEKSYKSNTTLPALLDNVKPDHAFIFVLDTLATPEDIEEADCSYTKICQKIQDRTKNFIKSKLSEHQLEGYLNKIEVLVLPGIGSYKCEKNTPIEEIKFEGSTTDIYGLFYYHLAKHLKTCLIDADSGKLLTQNVEVVVDTTHGLNFFTIMGYSSLISIIELLAHFFNVKLRVYNTDPAPIVDYPHSTIHLIENREIYPRYLSQTTSFKCNKYHTLFEYNKSREGELKRVDQELVNLLNSFSFFFENKIPLASLWFILKIYTKYKNDLFFNDYINEYYRNIAIENENHSLKIVRKLRFCSFCARAMLASLAVELAVAYIKTNIENFDKSIITNFENDGIPLRVLELSFAKLFFKDSIVLNRFNIETYNLRKLVNDLTEEWRLLDQFYSRYTTQEELTDTSDDVKKRNFFAHAGLSRLDTYVRKFNDEIYLKPEEANLKKYAE